MSIVWDYFSKLSQLFVSSTTNSLKPTSEMADNCNETIDLCDSEEEPSVPKTSLPVVKKRRKKKRKKARQPPVEVITIDDSAVEIANAAIVSNLNLSTPRVSVEDKACVSNAVPPPESFSRLEEDEIQIIGEKTVSTPLVRHKPKKFRFFHDSSLKFTIDRTPSKFLLKTPTKPFSFFKPHKVKNNNRKKKGNAFQNFTPSSPIRTSKRLSAKRQSTAAARKKFVKLASAKRDQVGAFIRSSKNKNSSKKSRVVLENGKPKFQLKPHSEVAVFDETDILYANFKKTICNELANPNTTDGTGVPTAIVQPSAPEAPAHALPDVQNTEPMTLVDVSENVLAGANIERDNQSNWSIYGSNAYKSGHTEQRSKGSLRTIVIDGSNVAMSHGNNKRYSCKGIEICSSYFKARGHTVVAFVPRYRMKASLSDDVHVLDKLEREGIVKFTPSREVGGQRICSYDDRFIVQFAADVGGIIVSNDNFRDLFEEQPLWRDTIRSRILQYTWVSETYIMFPPDPLGINGPNLDDFLRF